MDEDRLAVAREAVAATRAWRDQMRADWGTDWREPEEVLDQAVTELLAERDRLRAVVDATRAYVALIDGHRPTTRQDIQAADVRLRSELRKVEVADQEAHLTRDQLDGSDVMGRRCRRCNRTADECATQFRDVGFGAVCCEDCDHTAGSEVMGEHDRVVDRNAVEAAGRCPDCGNPDRYCDCPDRSEENSRG